MENTELSKLRRATPGHRIAAAAVDLGLNIVTLNIGWFIWNLVVMAKGQTPGKQLLKIRVMNEKTQKPVSWGHMAIRQILIPLASSLFFLVPYALLISQEFVGATITSASLFALSFCVYLAIWITDFVWLVTKSNRRLIDYWAKTVVVNEA